MKAKDIMTKNPVCFPRSAGLQEIAAAMVKNDCGSIPIVESVVSRRLVGIITDRDIVCRSVALGKNPLDLDADDCMSVSITAVGLETQLEECCELMESRQVRRMPVVDRDGCCVGVISQADIAERAPQSMTGKVVRNISHAAGAGQERRSH